MFHAFSRYFQSLCVKMILEELIFENLTFYQNLFFILNEDGEQCRRKNLWNKNILDQPNWKRILFIKILFLFASIISALKGWDNRTFAFLWFCNRESTKTAREAGTYEATSNNLKVQVTDNEIIRRIEEIRNINQVNIRNLCMNFPRCFTNTCYIWCAGLYI